MEKTSYPATANFVYSDIPFLVLKLIPAGIFGSPECRRLAGVDTQPQ